MKSKRNNLLDILLLNILHNCLKMCGDIKVKDEEFLFAESEENEFMCLCDEFGYYIYKLSWIFCAVLGYGEALDTLENNGCSCKELREIHNAWKIALYEVLGIKQTEISFRSVKGSMIMTKEEVLNYQKEYPLYDSMIRCLYARCPIHYDYDNCSSYNSENFDEIDINITDIIDCY